MNKQELIKKVAQDAGITQKQALAALESALASIKAAVADGQKVQLIGFGTFESKKREAREARKAAREAKKAVNPGVVTEKLEEAPVHAGSGTEGVEQVTVSPERFSSM